MASWRLSRPTLLAGFLCGCAGILPDIDHPLAVLIGIEDPRWLHIPLFLIALGFIICSCAYIAGLYIKVVLKDE
jgi:hypothetical protein